MKRVAGNPSLFRVAATLRAANDDTLVELENCQTLELLLLPAEEATGLLHHVGAAAHSAT